MSRIQLRKKITSAVSGHVTICRRSIAIEKPASDQHASHAASIMDSASGRSVARAASGSFAIASYARAIMSQTMLPAIARIAIRTL